jgi:hypothetical protein
VRAAQPVCPYAEQALANPRSEDAHRGRAKPRARRDAAAAKSSAARVSLTTTTLRSYSGLASNQNDEIVTLNANRRVVARVGEFEGIRRDGSPEGLLFPASIVILGDDKFVTNAALPLTPAVGDEPEEDVARWTISRIKLPHLDK